MADDERGDGHMTEAGRSDVVVIGAGMAGLAAARWLGSEGFEVLVLEAHSRLGGQWAQDNPSSGVWPEMRTNTARFLTRFSGVDYPADTAVFPRNQEVLALLEEFADRHGLAGRIRLGARATLVEAHPDGGYDVTWDQTDGEHRVHADRVVVASGRYRKPEVVPIPGLDGFAGSGGVSHAFRYGGPEAHRGQRVLVCGGSISALEVVSDLALGGVRRAHLAQRRQRYVMPKMITGTPIESFVFTRAGAVELGATPPEQLRAATAARVLELGGDPSRYGAPAPHPDIDLAGVAGSPHYLNLLAEDRISVHPWPREIEGTTVRFDDGTEEEVDAIIMATGFDLDLPFLSEDITAILAPSAKSIALAEFTFHPDLPGLAFAGLWPQLGPYAVPLEQQARWIAYSWSGRISGPSTEELRSLVAAGQDEGHGIGYREQHEMALRFGRLAGVDAGPLAADPQADPELRAVLPEATLSADAFRLVGPDADPDAAGRVVRDFRRYGSPDAVRRVDAALVR